MIERILAYEFSIFKRRISLKGFLDNPVFSGSLIMIIGGNLANFIAYIYHLIFGRLLGPAGYGEVAAFISTTGIIGATFSFLSLTIVKFVSAGDTSERKAFFHWLNKGSYKAALILGLIVAALTPFLSSFLHIDLKLFVVAAPLIFFSFMILVYRSFLHGLLRFLDIVILSNLELFLRLALGVLFVYLGYSVGGVFAAMLVASLLTFALSFRFVREFRTSTSKKSFNKKRSFFKYSVPILLSSLSTSSFFMTDVTLVKHFFSSYEAGLYASVSTLGRMIYYGAAPVALVMFPLSSQRYARGGSTKKVFLASLGLTLLISLFILALFYLYPETAINLLFGEKYLMASPLVAFFGLFMVIFSLSSLITNYFLAKEKTFVSYLMTAAALIQVVGISMFHSTLSEVIWVSVVSATILLVSLLIYLVYEFKKK